MTGRIGAIAIDGSCVSAADMARLEAEEIMHAERRRKAVLVVAGSAVDANDCRLLLSVLGLDAKVIAGAGAGAGAGRSAASATAAGPTRKREHAA